MGLTSNDGPIVGRRTFFGLGAAAMLAVAEEQVPRSPIATCPKHRVIAHTSGLPGGSRIATIADATHALALGVDGLDIDVVASRDRIPFVRHSTPGTDIGLQPFPLAAPIHTFDSTNLKSRGVRPLRPFFDLLKPGQRLLLDVKEPADHTLAAIERMFRSEPSLIQRVGLWIQQPAMVNRFAARFPKAEVGLSRAIRSITDLPGMIDLAARSNANAISIPVEALLTSTPGDARKALSELTRARKLGLLPYIWNLGESSLRHDFALRAGALGLTTDAPKVALKSVGTFEKNQAERVLCI